LITPARSDPGSSPYSRPPQEYPADGDAREKRREPAEVYSDLLRPLDQPSGQELHTVEPRVSAALRCLHLGLRVVTFLAGHLEEPLALAGVLTLAGIVGTLAGRLSLAGIHTCAMNLGLIAREGAARENGAEQQGGGSCGGNAGGVLQMHR